MWVSISTQGSMKYEIYSSIEHGNVIEQQMPGIHVHNQIGYTSTIITLNSLFFGIHYIDPFKGGNTGGNCWYCNCINI